MLVQYVRAELLDNGKELTTDAPPTHQTGKARLDLGHSQRQLTPSAGVSQYS
jgi:hypothetical protein